jgi:arsenite-transporting ATPase
VSARLHVLLGAGGVGKTTLAASYALALAQGGARVGLLGIDPSRRLEGALGASLADLDAPVAGAPGLRAAIVQPHQAIARWAAEELDAATVARLATNPFFVALGDRLATAIDVLAAVRIAEWAERDPALTDLVVDTAPGVAAIDFLSSPAHLEAMLAGRFVRWLRAAGAGGVRLGGRRILAALGRLAGTRMLVDLADFFTLVGTPLARMLARVGRAEAWLRAPDTELLLVTAPEDVRATGARQLATALGSLGLAPRRVIVNRTWPIALARELAIVAPPPGAEPLVAYARARLDAQAETLAEAAALAPSLVAVPTHVGLDRTRRAALEELGAALVRAWRAPPGVATERGSYA